MAAKDKPEKKKKPEFDANAIKISIDLTEAATRQMAFLKLVDSQPLMQNPLVISQSLRRYANNWLPLLSKHAKEARLMKPPLDVAWIAHCHQLCPVTYRKDMVSFCGEVPGTQSPLPESVTDARSRQLWQSAYPTEPFDLDLQQAASAAAPSANPASPGDISFITYDIASAAQRQKSFYYHVSLPHFRDATFLKSCLLRYRQFLRLHQLHPEEFLVPCYDIDLMWHAHQLTPHAYKADCQALLGRLLSHDDTLSDRSEGSKLSKAYARTAKLWSETFGESFAKSGCMYRGEPPAGKLATLGSEILLSACDRVYRFRLTRLQLSPTSAQPPTSKSASSASGSASASRKWQLALLTEEPASVGGLLKRYSVPLGQPAPAKAAAATARLAAFPFHPMAGCQAQLQLLRRTGGCSGICTTKLLSGSAQIHLQQHVLSFPPHSSVTFAADIPLPCEDTSGSSSGGGDTTLTVQLGLEAPAPTLEDCLLTLVPGDWVRGFRKAVWARGHFVVAVMPETVESMWGPVPLGRVPSGEKHRCLVASHRLVSNMRTNGSCLMFTVRVIHSHQLAQSVVQVLHDERMMAVAHMVGLDQLPTKVMVTNPASTPCLDPAVRQRAFLIKDSCGDWGILTGRWTGVKRTPPRSFGHLDAALHRLRPSKADEKQPAVFRLPTDDTYGPASRSLAIGGVQFNLTTGRVLVKPDCADVLQLIAVAFCAATLEVLCRPRAPPQPPPTAVDAVADFRAAGATAALCPEVRVLGAPQKTTDMVAALLAMRQNRIPTDSVAVCCAVGAWYPDWCPVRWHWHNGHWWQPHAHATTNGVIAAAGFDDLANAGVVIDEATGEATFEAGGDGGGCAGTGDFIDFNSSACGGGGG